MTIDNKIKNEILQYDLNREVAKILALSSGKIDNIEILPSDQSRTIKLAKFTYSPLSKAFEKQIKANEEQGKKQVEALEVLKPITQKLTIEHAIPKHTLSEETITELNEIKEIEKAKYSNIIKQINMHIIYRTISTFGRDIDNGTITQKEADEDQSNLLVEILVKK